MRKEEIPIIGSSDGRKLQIARRIVQNETPTFRKYRDCGMSCVLDIIVDVGLDLAYDKLVFARVLHV